MPRRVQNPLRYSQTPDNIDAAIKMVKLAIEREKLCHLKVKTASFPEYLTGRRRPRRPGQNQPPAQLAAELSLPALFEQRREQGCNDTAFLTDELTRQINTQLESFAG